MRSAQKIKEKIDTYNEDDIFAGKMLRKVRLLKGVSQEMLAEETGITFQQIQKYEKAINRMSVSRICQIARVLKIPTIIFFKDNGYTLQDIPEPDLESQKIIKKMKKLIG